MTSLDSPSSRAPPSGVTPTAPPWSLRAKLYCFITSLKPVNSEDPVLQALALVNGSPQWNGGLVGVVLVRYEDSPKGTGGRVTNIYVSSLQSAWNGRENWNIPKHLARFKFVSTGPNTSSIEVSLLDAEKPFFTASLTDSCLPAIPISPCLTTPFMALVQPPLVSGLPEDLTNDEWLSMAPRYNGRWKLAYIRPSEDGHASYGDGVQFPQFKSFWIGAKFTGTLIFPEEDENDVHHFTINEHYAKAFQYHKEREELAKLKEKYGSDADTDDLISDGSDSESDESEDEDGEELTPALDVAILRTLARIKAQDPGIYDAGRNCFSKVRFPLSLPRPAAPFLNISIGGGGQRSTASLRLAAALDAASSSSSSSSRSASPQLPTHTEEQAALRAETIAAFHAGTAADGGIAEREEGGLFTLREKARDEVEREEAEYRAYLEREVGPLEKILDLGEEGKTEDEVRQEEDAHLAEAEAGKKKKGKRGRKSAEERKETDQEFLINYILNRGWTLDPSVVHTGAEVDVGNDDLLEEDDDEFDEVAEHFESSYNFRFEEPDATHIQSFPRAVETVRRTTEHAERRRAARERRLERKEVEKAQRREEVKRLKGLKTRELEGKLERIGKEGGWVRSKALQALDLDGDWDATAHDRQMAAMLVETDGAGANGDDEKPTWDDDIDIDHIAPRSEDEAQHPSTSLDVKEHKKAKKKEKKKARDVDVDGVDVDEMDADAPEDGGNKWDEVEWDGTEDMRKRVLDQYMEELYELEFNDMVAGMPTRFRYNTAAKSSYGLTPTEILLADDKDLNEYVGLKKLAPYRKQRDMWDAKRGERLGEFKKKLSEHAGGVGLDLNENEHSNKAKKRKGKKERMREKAAHAPAEADAVTDEGATDEPVKKKRRRQKRSGQLAE
ncbi:hypothetical protein EDB84DRAFT_1619218 [Lactarius hengduanensis]|nr:hypothetical protein EDB84DRAFT_1619218 [Lactarius hengduanensis]